MCSLLLLHTVFMKVLKPQFKCNCNIWPVLQYYNFQTGEDYVSDVLKRLQVGLQLTYSNLRWYNSHNSSAPKKTLTVIFARRFQQLIKTTSSCPGPLVQKLTCTSFLHWRKKWGDSRLWNFATCSNNTRMPEISYSKFLTKTVNLPGS
jgi:hypothetical protein